MSKIFLTSSTFTWSYPGQNTVVPPVVRSRTVYMTIGCKAPPLARNTFLRLRKRRYSCECGKRFFGKNTCLPATTVPLAEWLKAATIRQKP